MATDPGVDARDGIVMTGRFSGLFCITQWGDGGHEKPPSPPLFQHTDPAAALITALIDCVTGPSLSLSPNLLSSDLFMCVRMCV